ncbi:NmrA domain-containing protein [Mycena kentingensis (nom. inval.)]|nr:NmrA domain-containing protein [Mycena kentingensis (nom. inval.)]
MARIFTIFGATGSQGSSVLDAVLADGTFTPRAVSRSLDSDASKALIARGVEVVVADLFNKDSLKQAVRGSEVVFGVTNFWDPAIFPADPKGAGEITQGKNLVDAAKEEGVKYFLWSSLPNISKESKGLYKHVYHCDNKALIEDHLRASGVPHSIIFTGWFLENFYKLGSLTEPSPESPGYIIPIPKFDASDKQGATWVRNDLGQAALALAKNYNTPKGAEVGVLGGAFPVVTAKFTYGAVAEELSKALKKDVKFVSVETTGMAELDEMFLFQAKIGMYHDTPVPNPKLVELGAKFGTMQDFIEKEIVPRFA